MLLFVTLIIGALVGLIVVAFILLTENLGSRAYPAGGSAWRRLLIPVAGSLITGFLLYRFFPNARGSGIPQTKAALFLHGGFISFRTVLGKFGLCSMSLASGIALGREGPSVQVGAGLASVLGRRLGLSSASIRGLVPVGASAALAAAFNTPISAVLFSLEEVMGDLHAPVLGSIVLSSATSWIVLHLLLGDEPLFHVPAYQLVHPVEFVFYAVLGVAGGLVSTAFVKLLLWQRARFLAVPASAQWLMPAVGGLTVGALGWYFPGVLGVGYAVVGEALNGQMLIGGMALLVALKLVATATCYASGNAGGIFGPSLFIGAMLGGSIGGVAHQLMPDYTGSVGAYALVGMGAAFAGIVRVPLTSVIMIFEITRDYSIVVPLMIANLISYFISSRLQAEPIYEALQHQDGIHLPAGARGREALLTVDSAFRRSHKGLGAEIGVKTAVDVVDTARGAWPVVDADGLRGILTAARLRGAAESGGDAIRVGDLVASPGPPSMLNAENFPHVHVDQSLDIALRRLAESRLPVLPVVSRSNVRELLGTVSVDDILAAYGMRQPDSQPAPEPGPAIGTSRALLTGVAVVLIVLAVVGGMLSHLYRAERLARAESRFRQGRELMSEERFGEAIEQLRDALSVSHSPDVRLALANALVKAGRLNESEVYFREFLHQSPASGPGNLGLARAYAQQGRVDEAVRQYHRAIYGSWSGASAEERAAAWLELSRLLWKSGNPRQARAELISMRAGNGWSRAARKQLGALLLEYGLAGRAAEMFGNLVKEDPRDAAALARLGEAEFALGDYRRARDSWRQAIAIDPGDRKSAGRLELSERILALDPTLAELSRAERRVRGSTLLESVLALLDRCSAGRLDGPSADAARKALSNTRNSADPVLLAQQLWNSRESVCGGARVDDEALSIVLAKLAPEIKGAPR